MARSVYHGVVRYMNEFDALPLDFRMFMFTAVSPGDLLIILQTANI